jgi:hypothetical protein
MYNEVRNVNFALYVLKNRTVKCQIYILHISVLKNGTHASKKYIKHCLNNILYGTKTSKKYIKHCLNNILYDRLNNSPFS